MLSRTSLRRRIARGFTLIEAALATIIVGTGVLAAVELFGVCAAQNVHGTQATAAIMLASNVQEASGLLAFRDPEFGGATFGPESGETLATYDDLDDFNNLTLSPPIDANRLPIASMSQYTQLITVRPIYPSQLSSNSNDTNPTISTSTYTGAVRVRVRVMYRPSASEPAEKVYERSWVRVDR